MANSLTIIANIDAVIVSNGAGGITADNLRYIADRLLDVDIRATGTIKDDTDSPTQGTISGDFFIRHFFDLNGVESIDYENRRLHRIDNSYFDWENDDIGVGTVTRIAINAPSSLIDFTGSTPLSGVITGSGSLVMNLMPRAISYSKLKTIPHDTLLGRYDDSSTGQVQEISLDSSIYIVVSTDAFGNQIGNLVMNTTGDVIISVKNVSGTSSSGSGNKLFTISSVKGNFVVKRIIWIVKNSMLSGGMTSPAQFNVILSSGTGAAVQTNANMLVNGNTVGDINWTDVHDGYSTSPSHIIPSGTTTSVKTTVLSMGYATLTYDVHIVGFYEFP